MFDSFLEDMKDLGELLINKINYKALAVAIFVVSWIVAFPWVRAVQLITFYLIILSALAFVGILFYLLVASIDEEKKEKGFKQYSIIDEPHPLTNWEEIVEGNHHWIEFKPDTHKGDDSYDDFYQKYI